MRDILTPSQTSPPQNTNRTVETTDRCPPQDDEEDEDEEIEFYNYMCGDQEPHVVYEDDKHFVFPRIKVK